MSLPIANARIAYHEGMGKVAVSALRGTALLLSVAATVFFIVSALFPLIADDCRWMMWAAMGFSAFTFIVKWGLNSLADKWENEYKVCKVFSSMKGLRVMGEGELTPRDRRFASDNMDAEKRVKSHGASTLEVADVVDRYDLACAKTAKALIARRFAKDPTTLVDPFREIQKQLRAAKEALIETRDYAEYAKRLRELQAEALRSGDSVLLGKAQPMGKTVCLRTHPFEGESAPHARDLRKFYDPHYEDPRPYSFCEYRYDAIQMAAERMGDDHARAVQQEFRAQFAKILSIYEKLITPKKDLEALQAYRKCMEVSWSLRRTIKQPLSRSLQKLFQEKGSTVALNCMIVKILACCFLKVIEELERTSSQPQLEALKKKLLEEKKRPTMDVKELLALGHRELPDFQKRFGAFVKSQEKGVVVFIEDRATLAEKLLPLCERYRPQDLSDFSFVSFLYHVTSDPYKASIEQGEKVLAADDTFKTPVAYLKAKQAFIKSMPTLRFLKAEAARQPASQPLKALLEKKGSTAALNQLMVEILVRSFLKVIEEGQKPLRKELAALKETLLKMKKNPSTNVQEVLTLGNKQLPGFLQRFSTLVQSQVKGKVTFISERDTLAQKLLPFCKQVAPQALSDFNHARFADLVMTGNHLALLEYSEGLQHKTSTWMKETLETTFPLRAMASGLWRAVDKNAPVDRLKVLNKDKLVELIGELFEMLGISGRKVTACKKALEAFKKTQKLDELLTLGSVVNIEFPSEALKQSLTLLYKNELQDFEMWCNALESAMNHPLAPSMEENELESLKKVKEHLERLRELAATPADSFSEKEVLHRALREVIFPLDRKFRQQPRSPASLSQHLLEKVRVAIEGAKKPEDKERLEGIEKDIQANPLLCWRYAKEFEVTFSREQSALHPLQRQMHVLDRAIVNETKFAKYGGWVAMIVMLVVQCVFDDPWVIFGVMVGSVAIQGASYLMDLHMQKLEKDKKSLKIEEFLRRQRNVAPYFRSFGISVPERSRWGAGIKALSKQIAYGEGALS